MDANGELNGKVRVLTVIDDLYFGGDEYRILNLCRHIDRDRFELVLLTTMRPDHRMGADCGSMRTHFADAGIDVLTLGYSQANGQGTFRSKVRNLVQKASTLRSFIRSHRPDVIDIHYGPANPTGVLAALGTGVPTAVTLYQVNTLTNPATWMSGHAALGLADLLITDSRVQQKTISKWLVRQRPIAVIPNGTPEPQPTRPANEVRAALGLPADPDIKVVAQIAALVPYKGQRILLQAAQSVLTRFPRAYFLIVGYEREVHGYKAELQQLANQLGISHHVVISGYPGQIGDVWQLVDIHAHPSALDSLPNAVLEGMSLAKPAVVAAVGGVEEALTNERTALLVPPDDPVALSGALLRMLSDSELRSRLGQAATRRYTELYRPEAMARALEHQFLTLAKKNKRRSMPGRGLIEGNERS